MGDMPEPKVVQSPQEQKSEGTSLAKKLYGSLSRKFPESKLAEELGEVRGCEGWRRVEGGEEGGRVTVEGRVRDGGRGVWVEVVGGGEGEGEGGRLRYECEG